MQEFKPSRRQMLYGTATSLIFSNQRLAMSDDIQKPAVIPQAPEVTAKTLSEQLLHVTTILEVQDSSGKVVSAGTGFFVSYFNFGDVGVPAIVTNKHVVNGAFSVVCTLTLADEKGKPLIGKSERLVLTTNNEKWIQHPDPEIDLAMVLIGGGLNELSKTGKRYHVVYCDQSFIPTEEEISDLNALEDMLIVGYPDGISDKVNNIPVMRRGITATPVYIDFQGKPQFLLDAAIFPGSSGSPVFLFNQGAYVTKAGLQLGGRVQLLGVVFAVALHTTTGEIVVRPAPTQISPTVQSLIPNNVGFCIKASKVLDFEPVIVKLGFKTPDGYKIRSKLSLLNLIE